MTFRRAESDDADAIMALVRRGVAFHEALDADRFGAKDNILAGYRRWLAQRIVDARSCVVVAANDAGLVVAMLIASVEGAIPIYRVSEFGYVHELWVDETYRNEGVARQLVAMTIEHFATIGVEQIRLETAAKNDAARKLFEQAGFRTATIEMMWVKPPAE